MSKCVFNVYLGCKMKLLRKRHTWHNKLIRPKYDNVIPVMFCAILSSSHVRLTSSQMLQMLTVTVRKGLTVVQIVSSGKGELSICAWR